MANNKKRLIEGESSQIQILEGYDDGYPRAKFLVTTVDVSNRNGRTYERALAERECQQRFEGRVLGQSKHPSADPDPLQQFLVFERAELEGDHEYFTAKIAQTQNGRDFIELAKAGAMFTVSRRGMGLLKDGVDKNNAKTKVIVTESYTLTGIDVLYPGTESDPNARMIQFETIETQPENIMEELTLESLREGREDLVTQIENAVTQPLIEKVDALETQVKALEEKATAAETLAQVKETQLTELTENNAAKISENEIALNEANAKIDALNESAQARRHLMQRVKGEKAAWLILDELFDTPTVADVDARYDEVKAKCDAVIENAVARYNKMVYTGDENNGDEKLKENAKPQGTPMTPSARAVARMGGL